jgi:hypothetical protein
MPEYRKLTVSTLVPVIHRVLVPLDVFYVYGYLKITTELPDVPMMWHERTLIIILPMRCVVERWTRGQPAHRDWSIVRAPPGIDTSWLRDHGEWVA